MSCCRTFSCSAVLVALVAASVVACGMGDGMGEEGDVPVASDSSEIRALEPGEIVGAIDAGETSSPIAYVAPPRYRALSFEGVAGDAVEAWVKSADGDAVAFLVDASFKSLATNDDATPSTRDALLKATLATTGKHYIVFRERDLEPATFTVSLTSVGADAGVAPPVPGTACTDVDHIRSRSCGACGKHETICLSNGSGGAAWSEYSVCTGEVAGGCVPGTVRDLACGHCGTRTETCTSYCAWSSSACTGEVANGCFAGDSEITPAGCIPGGFRRRGCTDACSWTPFTAVCEPAPATLDVGRNVGATTRTIVTLDSSHLEPRLTGVCPSARGDSTSTPSRYVTVHNPTSKTARVTVYHSQAVGGPILDTLLAAYAGSTPPMSEVARAACLKGVGDWGNVSLTGDGAFASLDGFKQVTIQPQSSVTIYNASRKPGDVGSVMLNVRTEALD